MSKKTALPKAFIYYALSLSTALAQSVGGNAGSVPPTPPEANLPFQIYKDGPSTVNLNDSTSSNSSEIKAVVTVSAAQANSDTIKFNILDFSTCNFFLLNEGFVLSADYGNATSVSPSGYVDVEFNIGLDKTVITDNLAWSWREWEPGYANLAFCARIDLVANETFPGTEDYVNQDVPLYDIKTRSVSYMKILYNITVDMIDGFSVDITTEEIEDSLDAQSAKVEYDVTACMCTSADNLCIANPLLTQNEALRVCLSVTEEDVVLRDVRRLTLTQDILAVDMIREDNNVVVQSSTVSVVGEGSNSVQVSTQVPSVFFLNTGAGSDLLVVDGMVVVGFSNNNNSARQLLQIGNPQSLRMNSAGENGERELQVEDADGLGTFRVNVKLSGGVGGEDGASVSAGGLDSSSSGMFMNGLSVSAVQHALVVMVVMMMAW